MPIKQLFKPVQSLPLRIGLFIGALVLFMLSGLYGAAALTGQGEAEAWQLASLMALAGGILLFKARAHQKP